MKLKLQNITKQFNSAAKVNSGTDAAAAWKESAEMSLIIGDAKILTPNPPMISNVLTKANAPWNDGTGFGEWYRLNRSVSQYCENGNQMSSGKIIENLLASSKSPASLSEPK
jgi:hypothetical protein